MRPISILCALSKAFERVVKNQICSYVNRENLLSPYQSGYRPGYSTKTAMLKVIDDIAIVLDRGSPVILILLDYSKAFDTISHTQLYTKLKNNFGFTNTAIRLIQSYLSERQQAVYYNGILSNFLPILSGVPQGSVLGPILFSLYVNDLPEILKYCSIHMFADDVQIYFDCSNLSPDRINVLLNEELKNISNWSEANSLKLNASKTNALLITLSRNRSGIVLPELILDQKRIPFVDQTISLGVTIEANLCWDKQVFKQCGKIYGVLRSIYPWAYYLNTDTKVKLFKSLILPHFIFIDYLLINVSAVAIDKLKVALNSCVRFVYKLNRFDRVTHLQKSLLGFSFYNFAKARCNIIMHQLITTKTPDYLYSKLCHFRSNRLHQFVLPRHSTTQYGRSFFVRGVVYWNELSQEMSLTVSKAAFIKRCRELF